MVDCRAPRDSNLVRHESFRSEFGRISHSSHRGAGMAEGRLSLPVVRRFPETARRDLWWVQPVIVFVGLSAFIVFSTWAAFQAEHYTYGPYLSPFYSPELFGNSEHS